MWNALSLAGFGFVACLVMTLSPAPSGPVGIVFAPWSTPAENLAAVAAADGRLMRIAAAGRIVVADGNEGFRHRVLQMPNAVFLVDPIAANLCQTTK